MKNWTPAQQAAIEAEHCSLAVSAAAGSGKTSVLTHRILRLLSEPDGIDAARLAVVTFTKNAAEELEDRLFSASFCAFRGRRSPPSIPLPFLW